MRATCGDRPNRRIGHAELFRQLRTNGSRRCTGVDGKLEWPAPVAIDIDQDEGLGRTRQAHGHFSNCLRPSCRLKAFWIIKTELAAAVVECNSKMPQKVVTKVAINLCTHCLPDMAEIDNPDIDILQLSGSNRD